MEPFIPILIGLGIILAYAVIILVTVGIPTLIVGGLILLLIKMFSTKDKKEL